MAEMIYSLTKIIQLKPKAGVSADASLRLELDNLRK
jgi:hypothetical protein